MTAAFLAGAVAGAATDRIPGGACRRTAPEPRAAAGTAETPPPILRQFDRLTDPHPTYPNPVIIEALCEVHMRRAGPGDDWPATLAGAFFKEIQDEFPSMEPVEELGVELSASKTGIHHRIVAPRTRFRFRHAQRNLLAQLGSGVFSLNVLQPYPGWNSFREDILRVWQRAASVLDPSAVTRAGLRYINRIPRTEAEQPPSAWLKPSDYLAPASLCHPLGFSTRTEASVSAPNRIIVNMRDEQANEDSPFGAILFDIDCIVEETVAADATVLTSSIEALHDEVWGIFSGAKTGALDRLLREEPE